MTKVIGITGGIGSGKSTFSNEVLKRGLKLIDSDKIVANIYNNPSQQFLNHLNNIGLGKSINKKSINKSIISNIIFSNKKIKLKLEKYIFKIVRKKRSNFIKKEKKQKTKMIFVDIPLLLENNLDHNFDIIISIISKRKERYKRIKKTKKLTLLTFKNIIKSQATDLVRRERSDILIYNNNSKSNYLNKINRLLDKIIL